MAIKKRVLWIFRFLFMIAIFLIVNIGIIVDSVIAQLPEIPGQISEDETQVHEAYLFSHMTNQDYGGLYYSVSLDGLHWKRLNQSRRIDEKYHGHSCIVHGHDGQYYLVGNESDSDPTIHFWKSPDLIHWEKYSDYTPDLKSIPGYPTAMQRIGAPKLFYDSATLQYLLTWHTPHEMGVTTIPEPYWASQRTIYVTSPDLQVFNGPPRRLFEDSFDMATIDVSIYFENGHYYAILKDERFATLDWPTGKTIRIAQADHMLGPYRNLSSPISPNFYEAPTLIPSPDGSVYYMYYEQYPGQSYGLSIAQHLTGPWIQLTGPAPYPTWNQVNIPEKTRHGWMIPISRDTYDQLLKTFPE